MTPGLERDPGDGNGYPLQYSYLEIPWTEDPGGPQSMGVSKEKENNLIIKWAKDINGYFTVKGIWRANT